MILLPVLNVNLIFRLFSKPKCTVTSLEAWQPRLFEPFRHVLPSFFEMDDRLKLQILFSSFNVEPAVHGKHFNVERVQFQLNIHEPTNEVTDVRNDHQEPVRQLELVRQCRKACVQNRDCIIQDVCGISEYLSAPQKWVGCRLTPSKDSDAILLL